MGKQDVWAKLHGKTAEEVAQKDRTIATVLRVHYIPDEKLVDCPYNKANMSYTYDLEKSFEEIGFVSQLEVTPWGAPEGSFMILSGHRRRLAGRKWGMKEFPCIIRPASQFKNELDVENFLQMINTSRNEDKDPLKGLYDYLMHEAYGRKIGVPNTELRRFVASRLGLSQAQADRYHQLSKVITTALDLISAGKVSATAMVPFGSREPEDQEAMLEILHEALDKDVELTVPVVRAVIKGYENGLRTWAEIQGEKTVEPERIVPTDTVSAAPGATDPEVQKSAEQDPPAPGDPLDLPAYSDPAQPAEEPEEAVEVTDPVDEPVAEPVPEDKPEPKPPLSEEEQKHKNGELISKTLDKLVKAVRENYAFEDKAAASEALAKMMDVTRELMDEMWRISNAYGLADQGKTALELCGEDSVACMGRIRG